MYYLHIYFIMSEKIDKNIPSFEKFYPFYIGQHANVTNRRLHYVGTSLTILVFVYAILSQALSKLPFCLLIGYGFAWVGHFFFEKNKPATFTYPGWSLRADFKMWKEITMGERNFWVKNYIDEISWLKFTIFGLWFLMYYLSRKFLPITLLNLGGVLLWPTL